MKPSKLNYLRLGTRMKPFQQLKIKEEVQLYNHAMRSQLPVPNGLVLLDGAWQRLLQDDVIAVSGEDVTVYGADILLETFALHAIRKPISISPIFGGETEKSERVEVVAVPKQNYHLIKELVEMWHSGRELGQSCRRDFLVLEKVETKWQGRAVSSAEYEDDFVFFDGAAEPILLPRLWEGESPQSAEAWQRRLQRLLIGVRRSFNLHGTEWEIEWRDDGRVCWLWGIRPMRERLPFTAEAQEQWKTVNWLDDLTATRDILNVLAPRWLAWYHNIDPTLPTKRLLWKEEAGKIWLNFSLLQDMLRRWGAGTEPLGGVHLANRYRAVRKAIVRWRLRRAIKAVPEINSADVEQQRLECATTIFNLIVLEPNHPLLQQWVAYARLVYEKGR